MSKTETVKSQLDAMLVELLLEGRVTPTQFLESIRLCKSDPLYFTAMAMELDSPKPSPRAKLAGAMALEFLHCCLVYDGQIVCVDK